MKIEENVTAGNPHGSFFENSRVIGRDDGVVSPIRQIGYGLFSLHMDSYLIIPLEKMNKEDLMKLGYSKLFQ